MRLHSAPDAPACTTVSFDLFILRSWDGSTAGSGGTGAGAPDLLHDAVEGGPTLLHTSFRNWPDGGTHAYPGTYPDHRHTPRTGAVERNTLGEDPAEGGDTVYHVSRTFSAALP